MATLLSINSWFPHSINTTNFCQKYMHSTTQIIWSEFKYSFGWLTYFSFIYSSGALQNKFPTMFNKATISVSLLNKHNQFLSRIYALHHSNHLSSNIQLMTNIFSFIYSSGALQNKISTMFNKARDCLYPFCVWYWDELKMNLRNFFFFYLEKNLETFYFLLEKKLRNCSDCSDFARTLLGLC